MTFTETQRRGSRNYYYRVRSLRKGGKVVRERVYLGADLAPKDLARKEREADRELGVLATLLTKEDKALLDRIQKAFAAEPTSTLQNRYEAFVSKFTHDSNAIEGNTLTLDETSHLLFEGLVPPKSLREIHEALNHKRAFDFMMAHRGDITKALILRLRETVVRDTLQPELAGQVGRYRTVQVYIRGVDWVPAPPASVPKDMKGLLDWYAKNRRKIHPIVTAANFHTVFELVHPFVDGNGRVGRLLMNFILRKNGLPMINLPNRRKREYYAALHKGQVEADLRPLIDLLLDVLKTDRPMF